jgi:hypothetical protein
LLVEKLCCGDFREDEGAAKSPSIPLYQRGKILEWFQEIPPFSKGVRGDFVNGHGFALTTRRGIMSNNS